MLGPDDEGRPLAAGGRERPLQSVQLGAAHGDVDRTLGHADEVGAGVGEERLEAVAKIVVEDLAALAALLVLGRVAVVDIVRRVGPGHVGQRATEHPLDIREHGGVAAQQAVLAQQPEIARPSDRIRSTGHSSMRSASAVNLVAASVTCEPRCKDSGGANPSRVRTSGPSANLRRPRLFRERAIGRILG